MIAFVAHWVGRLRRKRPAPGVRVSDDGLTLLDGDRPLGGFAWADVLEIVTYKRDLGLFDDIRLAFRTAGGWVEVGEDFEGWSELRDAIGRRFPAVPPDWLWAVMFPAFAPDERVLFERDGSGPSCP